MKQNSTLPIDDKRNAKPIKHIVRRMTGPARFQQILAAAIEVIAEKGLGATMQNVADRAAITQPLIHRHFPTRDDLIARVKEELLSKPWRGGPDEVLRDQTMPMTLRVYSFYEKYLEILEDNVWYRAFLHLALTDDRFAKQYTGHVTEVIDIILDESRAWFGYPRLDEVPPADREVEFLWSLHSVFAHRGLRQNVYHMELPAMGQSLSDQVQAYFNTFPLILRDIHGHPRT